MLRRIVAFLSVLLLLVGGASAGDEPKFDQFPAGKVYKGSAQCLLEIESKTYISGPCMVDSRTDKLQSPLSPIPTFLPLSHMTQLNLKIPITPPRPKMILSTNIS